MLGKMLSPNLADDVEVGGGETAAVVALRAFLFLAHGEEVILPVAVDLLAVILGETALFLVVLVAKVVAVAAVDEIVATRSIG